MSSADSTPTYAPLRVAVIAVTYDPRNRSIPDGDEWAYVLRMGDLDAESVKVISDEVSRAR